MLTVASLSREIYSLELEGADLDLHIRARVNRSSWTCPAATAPPPQAVDLLNLVWVYCIIVKKKLVINGSCLILVLTAVQAQGRPRHADFKTSVNNYQGANYLPKKCDSKINFHHAKFSTFFWISVWLWTKFVSEFSYRHTFVCGTLFPGIKLN